jgi:hypothetical protein
MGPIIHDAQNNFVSVINVLDLTYPTGALHRMQLAVCAIEQKSSLQIDFHFQYFMAMF